MYFTGDSYSIFIQTMVAQEAVKELGNWRNVIFQDDRDSKKRIRIALDAVKHVFYQLN